MAPVGKFSGTGHDDAMRFRHEQRYAGTVDEVHALLVDPDFRRRVSAAAGATSYDVTSTSRGDQVEVVVQSSLSTAAMPSVARSVLGATIDVHQTERWATPADGQVEIQIPGQPGHVVGSTALSPNGTGSVQMVDLDITVRVPLLGSKIERMIADLVTTVMRVQSKEAARS